MAACDLSFLDPFLLWIPTESNLNEVEVLGLIVGSVI
jgi:hypothetical protein